MGILESRISNKQILLLGLDNAGKTTLFNIMTNPKKRIEDPKPTLSYNIENDSKFKHFSIWDIGGKKSLRILWSSIYRNVAIDAIIFVVDVTDEERLNEAKMEIRKLTNEEELRLTVLIVLFNDKLIREGSSPEEEKKIQIVRFFIMKEIFQLFKV
jgi:small GTP-binding protein